jgi:hypothetical protein
MPFHLRELNIQCNLCQKPATVELFNNFNAPLGRYCRFHGRIRLAAMNATEKKEASTK